jgi:hypothetical protein
METVLPMLKLVPTCLILGAIYSAGAKLTAQDQDQSVGWVQWQKTQRTTTTPKSPAAQSAPEWIPKDGYASLIECRANGATQVQLAENVYRKNPNPKTEAKGVDRILMIISTGDDGKTTLIEINYLCFPGTFDPRPRQ